MTRYDDRDRRRATETDLDRRRFMAGMAAASLAAMAAGEPRALFADEEGEPIAHPKPTADCCILLWMGGGMAAPETFDPKAYAPFEVGLKADLLSKSRESLVTIGRMVGFLGADFNGQKLPEEAQSQLHSMLRDGQALSDHASYLGNKVSFLLDATVGMVSIEQNDIIKLFSVASVVLMPPTLIASIYGMNFKVMPELDWTHGYPLALIAMLCAAIGPYMFFKWKKWL